MVGESIFLIVLIVAIIAIIIISKVNKKKREKKEKEEREKQRVKAETERKEFINKIKNNPTVNQWADEVFSLFSQQIEVSPHLNCLVDVKATGQEFVVGNNLQKKYLRNIRETIDNCGIPKYIFVYNFAEQNLPELKERRERELFAFAFAELVKSRLEQNNHKCKTNGYPAIIDSWDEEKTLYQIEYVRKENTQSW